ncbi:MAG: hypothetical protein HKN07_15985 [Acidimicrobiia bacterium]|nr:hypothetical protein [Acidimicrobiia bacterium]
MRRRFSIGLAIALATALMAAPTANAAPDDGEVVVADRASGSISVIDLATQSLVQTIALPDDGEPMYVVSSRSGDRVYVGDRANDQVVVFDSSDWSVVGTVPTGAGVFHMWADPAGKQLWVNNDVDLTSTVIDLKTSEVLATVPIPADLVADGYKPHDVTLSTNGRSAFVSLVGGEDHDWVVRYDTRTFTEKARAAVARDPHVSVTNRALYVPAQDGDVVHVLDLKTLETIEALDVPGAHGAFMGPNKIFYTTNLPGGGVDGLWAIDTKTNTVLGSVDTAYAVPHNVVTTPNNLVFVTHSGGESDKVTIFSVSKDAPVPVAVGEVTVGLNPFGLAYVP